jgi:excisionase family DNA binding protein
MEQMVTDWLTIGEAVRQLKVGRTTLYRWVKQGRLKTYRVGPKAVRIRRSDLQRLITPVPGAGEEAGVEEAQTAHIHGSSAAVRPLTDEEQQRALAWAEASRRLLARQRAQRGGRPFEDESWPLIRAAREERSERLL